MQIQTLPSSARSYSREQLADIAETQAEVASLWRRMDVRFDTGWMLYGPSITAAVMAGQQRVAQRAVAYVPDILEATGQTRAIAAVAETNVPALVGVTGAGYQVADSLSVSTIRAKQAVAGGVMPRQALNVAGSWLTSSVTTILADTARTAEALGTYTRPVSGYIRMVNGGACGRCVVLAGRWFRKNAGFERHPNCFPAGVVTSGPALNGATRRWYEGEMVVLSTASGQKLTLTGNHPVLTSRGWVPANLIGEGDEVVRSTLPEGARPLVVPNHHEVPSRIEDVWASLSVSGFDSVESSPEDFHGDGQHGEVDVVRTDRTLNLGHFSPIDEHPLQRLLTLAPGSPGALDGQGAAVLLDGGKPSVADGLVRFGSLGGPLLGGHLGRPQPPGLIHTAALYAGIGENSCNHAARDLMGSGQAKLASTGLVLPNDARSIDCDSLSHWDAPTLPDPVEQGRAYASLGLDLLKRLSGQVELDRVIFSRSSSFSGHVYSLDSSEGWHTANSLIVSNCKCVHIPASENVGRDWQTNPDEYFHSLTDEQQIKLMGSKANAQAVRDGADINQVVNAYRRTSGMQAAQASPIRTRGGLKFTTEGTTRRGLAGQQQKGLRRHGPQQMRLMPESIYARAANQEEALRLLKLNGWIADDAARVRGRDAFTEARRVERNARARARRAERGWYDD